MKSPVDAALLQSHLASREEAEEHMFTPGMLANSNLKLIVNLCPSSADSNLYDPEALQKQSPPISYVHLPCSAVPQEPPPDVVVQQFLHICSQLLRKDPRALIAVHDWYGYNQTGYLVVCFLVERKDWSVDAALECFRQARPPGVYHEEYLKALYRRYDEDLLPELRVPLPPFWDQQAVFKPGWKTQKYVLEELFLVLATSSVYGSLG